MAGNERRTIIEGLAAIAVTIAEMGATEEEARATLVGWLERLRVDDVAVVREAAAAIASFPQPLDESPEELERAQPIRDLLGVPSAAHQLEATLRAREWLERLADDIQRKLDE